MVLAVTRNADNPKPVVSEAAPVVESIPAETVPVETAPVETETPEPEESEEISDDLIPADRLALLNGIAYYGDPAQCRMTVGQSMAFAETIEARTAELVPADAYGAAAVLRQCAGE